jgi:hypothetical protein
MSKIKNPKKESISFSKKGSKNGIQAKKDKMRKKNTSLTDASASW